MSWLTAGLLAVSILSIVAQNPGSDLEERIRTACSQCHAWTPPEILPKRAWPFEIQKMFHLANTDLADTHGLPIEDVTLEEAVRYFHERAPEDFELEPWRATSDSKLKFETKTLDPETTVPFSPAVSNVRLLDLFDNPPGPELLVCDMLSGWIYWADPDAENPRLEPLAQLSNPAHIEVVDLDADGKRDLLVAELGAFLPTDNRVGSVAWLKGTGDKNFEIHRLATGLGRVTDAQAADFDSDGDLDVVVAVFGWNKLGQILYLENLSSSGTEPASFRRRTLEEMSGAIHLPVVDFNGDLVPDFFALFSQEHESIMLYLNQGKGSFETHEVYTAPHPHWGSTGIQPVDLDGDGDLDVLMTNGDTLDDSIKLKPYQGVIWLENQGGFPFVEHRLDVLYGALRAEAGDLDQDGDLDIVASCFLPGLKEDEQEQMGLPAIAWYEQTAKGNFQPRRLLTGPCDYPTLDLGDFDGDGRLDVVSGRFRVPLPALDKPSSVMILRQVP